MRQLVIVWRAFLTMSRVRSVLLLLTLVVACHAQRAPTLQRVANPASPDALAPSLTTGTDGVVWMSWIEPLAEGGHRLNCAAFDSATQRWGDPREITRGADWMINWADTPQIAAGSGGRLAAVWFQLNEPGSDPHAAGYAAWLRLSTDGGVTWSTPTRLSQESARNEFVSLVPLPNDRWLAVWLDGRHRSGHDGAMALYGRVVGNAGPDERLDPRVCDCCPTSIAQLPDGSVYVVYRDRGEDEVRDLAGRRWRDGVWTEAQGLPQDGWKIDGCPVNGPVLARGAGSKLGLVWFSAAQGQPVVKSSLSTDFAVQWTMPHPLSRDIAPVGRVGAALHRDGTLWATWLDTAGTLNLAAVAPSGDVLTAHRLSSGDPAGASRALGIPRLAAVNNAPGSAPAPLVIARIEPGSDEASGQLVTFLASFPSSATSAGGATLADDCGCDRQTGTEGHPMRGRIVRLLPDQQAVLVAHEAIPGVMGAMTMAFKVDPRLLDFLKPGQEINARMGRRDDGRWWMFNVRIAQRPPSGTP